MALAESVRRSVRGRPRTPCSDTLLGHSCLMKAPTKRLDETISREISFISCPRDTQVALELLPHVFYGEAELVSQLGLTREWLRRDVGGLVTVGSYRRVYRGADVLAKLRSCPPATASTSRGSQSLRTGGQPSISPARAAGDVGSAQESPPPAKSLREKLSAWRASGQTPSPIKRPSRPLRQQRRGA